MPPVRHGVHTYRKIVAVIKPVAIDKIGKSVVLQGVINVIAVVGLHFLDVVIGHYGNAGGTVFP